MSGAMGPGRKRYDLDGNADEARVLVFRVVDARELMFLQSTGHYGSNPHRSGKYFALTRAGALAFAAAKMNVGCSVTATTLPRSILGQAVAFHDPGLHGAGPSLFFAERQLAILYATMADPWIVPEVES